MKSILYAISIGAFCILCLSFSFGKFSNIDYDQVLKNMLIVEGGDFMMGCSETKIQNWQIEDKDCGPMHKVELAAFKISKFEVTNKDYIQFLNSISSDIEINKSRRGHEVTISYNENIIAKVYSVPILDGSPRESELFDIIDSRNPYLISYNFGLQPGGSFYVNEFFEFIPVTNISWHGAKAYCEWLNAELNSTKKFRLPTEAEWEYSAFGGVKRIKDEDDKLRYQESPEDYKDKKNYNKEIHIIGQSPPNKLGLYNMRNNVFEYCIDWYEENHYSYSKDKNPTGPKHGNFKVVRGNSYRITKRDKVDPNNLSENTGFRLVQEL